MIATHIIEKTGANSRSRLEVEVTGGLALLLWPLLRRQIQQSVERENAGLKMYCERSTIDKTTRSLHQ